MEAVATCLNYVTMMQAARPDKATALAELGETLLLLLERVSDGDVNGLVRPSCSCWQLIHFGLCRTSCGLSQAVKSQNRVSVIEGARS